MPSLLFFLQEEIDVMINEIDEDDNGEIEFEGD